MEDERIEVVRTWPEPQSVRDIQVFIGFDNFYRREDGPGITNFRHEMSSLPNRD